MAIRWSRKAKRFYDDNTGHPVTRTRGFLSSIGRRDYKKYHPHRKKKIKKRATSARVGRREISGRYEAPETPYEAEALRREIGEGYRVRPLSEEFEEELEQFDGTLDEDMDFDDYMDFLDEDDEAMDAEDSYSED